MWRLSGTNTYIGTTLINRGILALSGGAALADTAAVVLTNASVAASLQLNDDETIGSLAGGAAINGVALGAHTLALAGSADTSFAGVISGTGSVTKSGTGTQALTAVNTYSGTTTLNGGAFTIGNNAAFGSSGLVLNGGTLQGDGTARTLANDMSLTANSAIGGASALTLDGDLTNTGNFTLTSSNTALTTLAGDVFLSEGAVSRTLTLGGTGNITVSGAISNGGTATAGALAKTGAGMLILSGANTYAGATTLSAGTLKAGAANSFSIHSAVTTAAGTTLDLDSFDQSIDSLTAAGAVAFGTGNTLTTAGGQTYAGKITGDTISLTSTAGGDIMAENATNDFTGDVTIATTGAASVADANSLTLGTISAATFLGRALDGDLTLNGAVAATSATGTPLVLAASGKFVNTVGAAALTIGAGGRWLVYSVTPLDDTRGSLAYDFKQYNTAYGAAIQGAGNGFIYTVAPAVTAGLIGTVSKIYDGTQSATLADGNYTVVSGAIDGDDIVFNNPAAGTYGTAGVGTGKTVSASGVSIASATDGTATVYGYQLASTTAQGAIGMVTPASLTVTANDQTKTAGTQKTFAGNEFSITGTLYGTDAVTGVTLASPGAGAAASVLSSPYAITPSAATGSGISNYTITYVDGLLTLTVPPPPVLRAAALPKTVLAALQTPVAGDGLGSLPLPASSFMTESPWRGLQMLALPVRGDEGDKTGAEPSSDVTPEDEAGDRQDDHRCFIFLKKRICANRS